MDKRSISSHLIDTIKNTNLPDLSSLGDFVEVLYPEDIPELSLLAVSITTAYTNIWHYGVFINVDKIFDYNFGGPKYITYDEFKGGDTFLIQFKEEEFEEITSVPSIGCHRNGKENNMPLNTNLAVSNVHFLKQKKDHFLFDGLFRQCCEKEESFIRMDKVFELNPKYSLINNNCLTMSLYVKQIDFDPFIISNETKKDLVYYTRLLPDIIKEELSRTTFIYVCVSILNYFVQFL